MRGWGLHLDRRGFIAGMIASATSRQESGVPPAPDDGLRLIIGQPIQPRCINMPAILPTIGRRSDSSFIPIYYTPVVVTGGL